MDKPEQRQQWLLVGRCLTNDNYVFAVNQGGALMVMDKNTGATVQKIQTKADKVRSDVSFYNGRIYFSTQSGYLYSYNLTADGKVDLDNLIEPLYYGGQSTFIPAVYNNRLYIGISSGSTFGEDGAAILVADINPENGAMTKAYLVPTKSDFAYCQTSGLIINGYEDEDGYVYVYFLVNSAKGSLYMVKDKPGMTAPDPESGLFYTPSHEQYCIASAVADSDGTIYLKNDSAWQCAIRRAESYLKSVERSDRRRQRFCRKCERTQCYRRYGYRKRNHEPDSQRRNRDPYERRAGRKTGDRSDRRCNNR